MGGNDPGNVAGKPLRNPCVKSNTSSTAQVALGNKAGKIEKRRAFSVEVPSLVESLLLHLTVSSKRANAFLFQLGYF